MFFPFVSNDGKLFFDDRQDKETLVFLELIVTDNLRSFGKLYDTNGRNVDDKT